MVLKTINKSILIIGMFIGISSANAGVITQHTSINTYQRTCPGLQDPNYVTNWLPAIEAWYGPNQSANHICHFNGGNQATMFNNDGTPKEGYEWLPNGAPFTESEVGTLDITADIGTTGVSIGTEDSKYYADVILDETNLGLPQFKLRSGSDEYERNSVNGYAATEFLWLGEDETLEYSVDFDFFNSGNLWAIDGVESFHDYIFNLSFGAYKDMVFGDSDTWPIDYGTVLSESYFSSFEESLITTSEDNPYRGTLSVSFDVKTGDQFFLYGQVQAFGLNGGYTDASHTVTSGLAIQGLTQEESLQTFQQALRPAVPTNQIPEPSSIVLMMMGVITLLSRKRIK